jgi:probable HAF family extracellular repeat protein
MKRTTHTMSLVFATLASTAVLAHAQYTAYYVGPGLAYGINSFGTVVGFGDNGDAFSYTIGGGMNQIFYQGPACGINDSGTIVGGSYGWTIPPWTYSSGVLTYISLSGASSAYGIAYAINNSGTVVGEGQVTGGFSCSGGVVTYLSGFLSARAINNSGTIVGQSGSGQACIYSGGQATGIGLQYGCAYGINNSGTIVGGTYAYEAVSQAFSYSGGAITYIIPPIPGQETSPSAALGINDSGTIVGYYSGGPFSYSDGQVTALSPFLASIGLTGGEATAINDNGDIVGWASEDGNYQAFLLVPTEVPEPSTGALVALGSAGLICRTLRRRR